MHRAIAKLNNLGTLYLRDQICFACFPMSLLWMDARQQNTARYGSGGCMVGNLSNNLNLRLVGEPLAPRHEQSKKPDTLQAWAPQDSISHAEAMLAHTERKMANLKLLLDLPEQNPDRPGPWAA
jgi:hypothetical protein